MPRRRFGLVFVAFAFAVCAILVGIRASEPASVVALREAYFDLLQQIHPRQSAELPVRVVDIDEASLSRLGQWPWPRHLLATLNARLAEMGAAVVVYDVIFAEPDRLSLSRLLDDPVIGRQLGDAAAVLEGLSELDGLDYDRVFADSMGSLPVVLGISDAGQGGGTPLASKAGFVQVGSGTGALPRLTNATTIVPGLYEAAAGIGSINVSPAATGGVVRQVPLVWQTDAGFVPGLAVEALRIAMQESTFVLQSDPADIGLSGLRLGGYEVPTDENGQFRVHYRHDVPGLYVSAADILGSDPDPGIIDRIAGNIVFVGTSAAGLLDLRQTALGDSIPGVSIHAQIVEQILLEQYLNRTTVQDFLEILIFIATAFVVFLCLILFGPVASVVTGGVAGGAVLALSWVLFTRNGLLLDATFPMVGGFIVFTALSAFQFIIIDREKRLIRRSFAKYVSPSILSEIEQTGQDLKLGGGMRNVLVMFSDIRNFTPLSETMPAEDLVALLNELFSELTDEILEEKGTIDKYIGDAVMAFWNAPVALDDYHTRACLGALRMRARLKSFSAMLETSGRPPIRMATGLAAGPACVGNMGSRDRFNYSVVGEVVNEAARIEASCRVVGYDIVASKSVADHATGMALLEAGDLELKGVSQRSTVYLVVGDQALAQSAEFRALKDAHDRLWSALREGRATAPYLAKCRALCDVVDPGLTEVYRRLEQTPSAFLDDLDRMTVLR